MLYIIRVGDVIGRGEESRASCEIAALCSQAEPSARRGCTEQEPGSKMRGAQDQGSGGLGLEGSWGVETDNPITVRSSHTGTKGKGGEQHVPSGAAISGASTPFFYMQPPLACCGSAGRAMGLLV